MAKMTLSAAALHDLMRLPRTSKIMPFYLDIEVTDPAIDPSVVEVSAVFGQDYDDGPYFIRYDPVTYNVAGHTVAAADVDKFLKSLKKK